MSRLQFFSTLLSKLARAAAKGFNSLSVVVEDLKLPREFVELPDPVQVIQDGAKPVTAGVDYRGVALYPKDAPQELTPIRVTGDGSCFYNACSVALYGTESYSKELRVRTIIELVSSLNYHSSDPLPCLTGPGVSGTVSAASLLDTVLSNNAREELIVNGREAALKKEVMNTCQESSWANILHFAAMANVLSGPVRSIFPEHSRRIRPYYNRTFYPRDWNPHLVHQNDKPSIYIMWCGELKSTAFVPDHFVPCMKQSGGNTTAAISKWSVSLNKESELELWKISGRTGDAKVLGTIFTVEKCDEDSERIKIIWTTVKREKHAGKYAGNFQMSLFKADKATPPSLAKARTIENFHKEVTLLLNANACDYANGTPEVSPIKTPARVHKNADSAVTSPDSSPMKRPARVHKNADSAITSPDSSPMKRPARVHKNADSDITSPDSSPDKRWSSAGKRHNNSKKRRILAETPKKTRKRNRKGKLVELEFRQQVNIMRDILLESNNIADEDEMGNDQMLDRNAKGCMLTKELVKETGLKVSELNRFKVHKFVASLSKRCYRQAEIIMDRWEVGDIPGQPSKSRFTVKQSIFFGLPGLSEETCYKLLSDLAEGNAAWLEHKARVLKHKAKDIVPSKQELEEVRSDKQALERRIQILKEQLATAMYDAPKDDQKTVSALKAEVASVQEEKRELEKKVESLLLENKKLKALLDTQLETNLKQPSEEELPIPKRSKTVSNWEGKEVKPGQLVAVAFSAPRRFHVGKVLETDIEKQEVLVQFYKPARKILVDFGEPEWVTPQFVLDTSVDVSKDGVTLLPPSKSEEKRLKEKAKQFWSAERE